MGHSLSPSAYPPHGQYGFHRDELATLDDARSLAWSYIAYPPVTPFLARIAYELWELRAALRAGDVWLETSRRYANPENYLIPPASWPALRPEVCTLTQTPQDSAPPRGIATIKVL